MRRSVIVLAITAVATGTTVMAQPGPGFAGGPPGFPPGGIIGMLPLMSTLDGDGDGEISVEEMAGAEVALRSADADGSGVLEGAELMPNRGFGGFGRGAPGGFDLGNLLGILPLMSALDGDGDGVLSDTEIGRASESLATLDGDDNGRLTSTELLPVGLATIQSMRPSGRRRFGGFGGGQAPTGPALEPEDVAPEDGLASIASHEVFERLSYQGPDVLIDRHLLDLEYVKFILLEPASDEPKTYFINTQAYRAHMMFASTIGLPFGNPMSNEGAEMFGVLIYRPELRSPNGQPGLYSFEFEPNNVFDFELIQVAHDRLIENAPILAGRLAYHPLPAAVSRYQQQKPQYEAANLPALLDDELYAGVSFLPLNPAEGFGLLRAMELTERPGARDIVLYESLPNELPRVAGIITAVPQTPLSHVNLRAVQDRVPNAYIEGAAENTEIASLIGRTVYFRVDEDGYELREASAEEVDAHFEEFRPQTAQIPVRDLTMTEVRPLSGLGFGDSVSVGVKAANVATLGSFGLPEGVVPDGFAIPFYFYDEFMTYNGFYDRAREMQAEPGFPSSADLREAALAAFRAAIEDADLPSWMMDALAELHNAFPSGSSIRLRSSTNNEDLPGFSGAGLYDSVTHRTDEGHLANSVKQVFASLWNFRAYEEREFYRVDHYAASMGVLAHPNFSNEIANGVAVSDDIVYQDSAPGSAQAFYINVQLGEDLVTNPEEFSIPEELLLDASGARADRVIATSNRGVDGELILSVAHRSELREHLRLIHDQFQALYAPDTGEPFAIEIEFKITAQGELSIKQARPWVF